MRLPMRVLSRVLVAAAIIAGTTSCGDVIRQGRSPVYIVVTSVEAAAGRNPGQFFSALNSDVIVEVRTPPPCTDVNPCPTSFNDLGRATMQLAAKDTAVAPSQNNVVTLSRYHVEYTRADGHNTPGLDVPYPFDGVLTATVPAIGSAVVGFELVRIAAKLEAPLRQLVTNFNYITTFATVTFYGKDQVGNDVSATGNISIVFGNFGDF